MARSLLIFPSPMPLQVILAILASIAQGVPSYFQVPHRGEIKIYCSRGNPDAAYVVYQLRVAERPYRSSYHDVKRIATAYSRVGRRDRATNILAELYSHNRPVRARILLGLGQELVKEDPEMAIGFLLRAVEESILNAPSGRYEAKRSMLFLGRIAERHGRTVEAVEWWQRSALLAFRSHSLAELARLFERKRDYQEALYWLQYRNLRVTAQGGGYCLHSVQSDSQWLDRYTSALQENLAKMDPPLRPAHSRHIPHPPFTDTFFDIFVGRHAMNEEEMRADSTPERFAAVLRIHNRLIQLAAEEDWDGIFDALSRTWNGEDPLVSTYQAQLAFRILVGQETAEESAMAWSSSKKSEWAEAILAACGSRELMDRIEERLSSIPTDSLEHSRNLYLLEMIGSRRARRLIAANTDSPLPESGAEPGDWLPKRFHASDYRELVPSQ